MLWFKVRWSARTRIGNPAGILYTRLPAIAAGYRANSEEYNRRTAEKDSADQDDTGEGVTTGHEDSGPPAEPPAAAGTAQAEPARPSEEELAAVKRDQDLRAEIAQLMSEWTGLIMSMRGMTPEEAGEIVRRDIRTWSWPRAGAEDLRDFLLKKIALEEPAEDRPPAPDQTRETDRDAQRKRIIEERRERLLT